MLPADRRTGAGCPHSRTAPPPDALRTQALRILLQLLEVCSSVQDPDREVQFADFALIELLLPRKLGRNLPIDSRSDGISAFRPARTSPSSSICSVRSSIVRCEVLMRSAFASSARVLSASDKLIVRICSLRSSSSRFLRFSPRTSSAIASISGCYRHPAAETCLDRYRPYRSSFRPVREEPALFEAPFNCVAVRTFSQGRDGDQSPAREIRLNKVSAMLWRGRHAAERKPEGLGKS